LAAEEFDARLFVREASRPKTVNCAHRWFRGGQASRVASWCSAKGHARGLAEIRQVLRYLRVPAEVARAMGALPPEPLDRQAASQKRAGNNGKRNSTYNPRRICAGVLTRVRFAIDPGCQAAGKTSMGGTRGRFAQSLY